MSDEAITYAELVRSMVKALASADPGTMVTVIARQPSGGADAYMVCTNDSDTLTAADMLRRFAVERGPK